MTTTTTDRPTVLLDPAWGVDRYATDAEIRQASRPDYVRLALLLVFVGLLAGGSVSLLVELLT